MKVLGWFAGGYAALVGGAFALQRAVMYPAPKAAIEPVVEGGKLLAIAGPDGRTVHALHIAAPPGAPTIVHFHGNGEALADQSGLARALGGLGLGVLAVEYPGYGLSSDGSPTEKTLYADCEAALIHLRDRLGVPPQSTVIQGQSLGTGVAVEMAKRGFGSRVVLIAPFTSMAEMARRVVPFLPTRVIVRDRYDNREKAPSLMQPVLIIHGLEDEVVPVEMSRRLAALFPNAEVYLVAEAHHNDLFLVDGDNVLDRIAAFARGGASQ